MKKIINDPSKVVREMLEGFVVAAPGTALMADETVVVRADLPEKSQKKVAVLSGGGSGHEPAHAGFVGKGMLTAAIAGDVFTSPSTDAVLAAIRQVAGPAGALLIVKNYTGDRLNFGLAAELARNEGIPVEVVIVADDVALRDTVAPEHRRGIAGTILVHKVAGAAAEKGCSLTEVAELARKTARAVSTMGIALGSCTLPSVGRPGFVLGENEIEVGLGIHGEPGVRKAEMSTASDLCELVLDTIMTDFGTSLPKSVALLVNGLGSTPPMELSIVQREAISNLRARGIEVERVWNGTLLSALDMPGFSLSVLPVDATTLELLDADCSAPSWPRGGQVNKAPVVQSDQGIQAGEDIDFGNDGAGQLVKAAALAAATALIAAEPELTELDSLAGDGDLGQSMQRGSEAIRALSDASFASAASGFHSIAGALRKAIGGSSGPFYATSFLRAARVVNGDGHPSDLEWAAAFDEAVLAISDLGGAKVGDRTMIDALRPAADALKVGVEAGRSLRDAWGEACKAAETGLEATKTMRAGAGRAAYLGERTKGIPDGGAAAVVIWMKAIATA